jgi:hypothetical protein
LKFHCIAGQVGEQLPHLNFVRSHSWEVSHNNLCAGFGDCAFQVA